MAMGIIVYHEACDDGNTAPGDGCDWCCRIESGWTCEGEPLVCTGGSTPVPSVGTTGVAVLGVAVRDLLTPSQAR